MFSSTEYDGNSGTNIIVLLICFSSAYYSGANYCLDKVHQFRFVNRNYKTVVQQRLLQDIFKTPNQQIHDESSEKVQINTDKRKTFEGAEDATIPLVSGKSAESR
jgi:hypothetical protein